MRLDDPDLVLPPDEIAAKIVESHKTASERFKRVAAVFASSENQGRCRHRLGSPYAADTTAVRHSRASTLVGRMR